MRRLLHRHRSHCDSLRTWILYSPVSLLCPQRMADQPSLSETGDPGLHPFRYTFCIHQEWKLRCTAVHPLTMRV